MHSFIDGAIFLEFAVVGLYFLRYWRMKRDRFFLLFSLAFWILAFNRVALTWLKSDPHAVSEAHVLLYAFRLLAFTLLLIAIIDKNMKAQPRRAAG